MAFDEALAQRVRELLNGNPYATQKKMFGGLCFMISGNVCVALMGEQLLVSCYQRINVWLPKH